MELKRCDETCATFDTCTHKLEEIEQLSTEELVDTAYDLLISGFGEAAVRAFIEIELEDPDTIVVVNKDCYRLKKILSEI